MTNVGAEEAKNLGYSRSLFDGDCVAAALGGLEKALAAVGCGVLEAAVHLAVALVAEEEPLLLVGEDLCVGSTWSLESRELDRR